MVYGEWGEARVVDDYTRGCASRNTKSMCRFVVSHPGGQIVIVPHFYNYLGSDGYYYNPNKNSRTSFVIQSPRLVGDLLRIWPVTDPVENIMSLM